MTVFTKLTPRLVVADAEAAIRFYERVFDATRGMILKVPDGAVIHAELEMGGLRLSLTEADGEHNRDPKQLGGSPMILTWVCDDPDAVEASAKAAGGTVIFPVNDQFYGMREGRFADPAGHLWIVTKVISEMSQEELQRGLDENM